MTLGTKVQTATDAYATARRERFSTRAYLWRNAGAGLRVGGCGRRVRSSDGVVVKVSGLGPTRRAGLSGVMTCGSVWVCPVCSAKVLARRQGEIETLLARWHERGGRVGMVTLTMRHRAGQSLTDLWDALSYAWGKVTSGRAWKAEQSQHGVPTERTIKTGARAGQVVTEDRIHFVRVVEVTYGEHGWHVHVHALVLLRADRSRADVEMLGDQMFTRWSAALQRRGLAAPSWRHGVDARRIDGDPSTAMSDYFTKANYGASAEVTRADKKTGRGGNFTPWELLRAMATGSGRMPRGGLAEAGAAWQEWERGSLGRRQLTFSHGLREMLLSDVEDLTDAEVADLDEGGVPIDGDPIHPDVWWAICRHHWTADLLEAAEADDWGGTYRGFLAWVAQECAGEIARVRGRVVA